MNALPKIKDRFNLSSKLKIADDLKPWISSKICNLKDWERDEFIEVAQDLMQQRNIPAHRKVWEFCTTILALKECGLLNDQSIGLSVAAGVERILYYLANKTNGIIATDIYGDGPFSSLEAPKDFLKDQQKYAPFEYRNNNLNACHMNALDLEFPSNLFDYAICLSSIEHFGGIKSSKRSISEISRVLKPGGIAVIVTEISLNDYKTDQTFTNNDIDKLLDNSDLHLLRDFEFETSNDSIKYLCDMESDDLEALPHINLKYLSTIFTSGILVLRKYGYYKQDNSDDLTKRKNKIWSLVDQFNSTGVKEFKPARTKLHKKILNRFYYTKWRLESYFL